jgi:hypothetical protein
MTAPVSSVCSSAYPIGLVFPLSHIHGCLTVSLHEKVIQVSEFKHVARVKIDLLFYRGISFKKFFSSKNLSRFLWVIAVLGSPVMRV